MTVSRTKKILLHLLTRFVPIVAVMAAYIFWKLHSDNPDDPDFDGMAEGLKMIFTCVALVGLSAIALAWDSTRLIRRNEPGLAWINKIAAILLFSLFVLFVFFFVL